jgi:hypothetical protein
MCIEECVMEEPQFPNEQETPQSGGYEIYDHTDEQGNVYIDGSGPYNPNYESGPNDPLRPQESTDYTQ